MLWEASPAYLPSSGKDSGHEGWGELASMEYVMPAVTPAFLDTMEEGDCKLTCLSVLFSLPIFIWVLVLAVNSSHGCNNVNGALSVQEHVTT